MNKSYNLLILIVAVAFCVGCGNAPSRESNEKDGTQSSSQQIKQVVQEYKTLKLMTPEPVFVNPELAMLCVGASKEMVDAARVEDGPHANCSVNIYMNELAANAFDEDTNYPVGSIVVKEKQIHGYRTKESDEWQGTGNGVGGMIKRADGFDSKNGNWEYFYFESVEKIESGKMDSCIACHSKAKDNDYVFGSWHPRNRDFDDSETHGY